MKKNIAFIIGMSTAILKSFVTNTGKKEVSKLLSGAGSGFLGIGVGNLSTYPTENDTGLCGGETKFKPANNSYFSSTNSSWISQFNSTFVYGDLTTHAYNEIVVVTNGTTGNNTCLLRATFGEIQLGSGDSLGITAQISTTNG